MEFRRETLTLCGNNSFAEKTAGWDPEIRAFWARNPDRVYHLTVMSQKMGVYPAARVLEIGAEYYSKYIKSVFHPHCELTLLDLKPRQHPDILNVVNLNGFVRCDLACECPRVNAPFDFAVSFGVLSHYNLTKRQCSVYLKHLASLLKDWGICVIKLDLMIMATFERFPSRTELLGTIDEFFEVWDSDVLLTSFDEPEFLVLYCYKRVAKCGA